MDIHDLLDHCDWAEAAAAISLYENISKIPSPANRDLPLHVSLRNKAPTSLLMTLIESYPEAVDLPSSSSNEFPLSLALQYLDDPPSDLLLRLATPASSKGVSSFGETPLFAAISKKAPTTVVSQLLSLNPSAAGVPDEMDQFPLHEAVAVKADEALIRALYDAYPDAAAEENRDGTIVEGFWTPTTK